MLPAVFLKVHCKSSHNIRQEAGPASHWRTLVFIKEADTHAHKPAHTHTHTVWMVMLKHGHGTYHIPKE